MPLRLSRLSAQALAGAAACLGLLTACASPRPLVMTEPIGPTRAVSRADNSPGRLVVYSAWDRFDTLDSQHPKHTAYRVQADKSPAQTRVQNRAGSFGEQPQSVVLAPGKYLVTARATNVGPVQVPVVIRSGEVTVVYLDGVTGPPSGSTADDQWIRQPNGRIVGSRDTARAE